MKDDADGLRPAECADADIESKLEFPYKELCYQILGLLYKVQNDLGTKMQEKHYQRALEILFKEKCILYERQVPVSVSYQGEFLGRFLLDFLIDSKITLELKVTDRILTEHRQQMIRYLEATRIPVGYLANFRMYPLQFVRVVATSA